MVKLDRFETNLSSFACIKKSKKRPLGSQVCIPQRGVMLFELTIGTTQIFLIQLRFHEIFMQNSNDQKLDRFKMNLSSFACIKKQIKGQKPSRYVCVLHFTMEYFNEILFEIPFLFLIQLHFHKIFYANSNDQKLHRFKTNLSTQLCLHQKKITF